MSAKVVKCSRDFQRGREEMGTRGVFFSEHYLFTFRAISAARRVVFTHEASREASTTRSC